MKRRKHTSPTAAPEFQALNRGVSPGANGNGHGKSADVKASTPVGSHRLGHLSLNENHLQEVLKEIEKIERSPAYAHFQYGERWASIMVANRTGNAADGVSTMYVGSAKPTENAARLAYLWRITQDVFNCDHLKSMRVFEAVNGGILPHVDYWDLEVQTGEARQVKGFKRIHLAIQTNEGCRNSENGKVYHIGSGDLAFVDGSIPHASIALGSKPRLHVVWDFDHNMSFGKIFKEKAIYRPGEFPVIEREELTPEGEESLLASGAILSEMSFQAVLHRLAVVHFSHKVSAGRCYDWLIEAARRTKNQALIVKAVETKRIYLGGAHVNTN